MNNIIQHRLHESLEKQYLYGVLAEALKLSKSDIAKYVNIGINSFYENESMAMSDLKKYIEMLNRLPNPVKLYRIVFLNNEKELNKEFLGSHYSLNRRTLEASHSTSPHIGANGKPFIMTVIAPLNLIDFNATISTRMQYPHELEITLKNKGKGAKLMKLGPVLSQDDTFDDLIDF